MSLQQGQVSTTASSWSRGPSPLAFYLPLASCICATWIAGVHHQTLGPWWRLLPAVKISLTSQFLCGESHLIFFMKDLTANGFWVSSFHLSTDMQTDIISYMYHMGYHLSELSQHRTMRILTVIESEKKNNHTLCYEYFNVHWIQWTSLSFRPLKCKLRVCLKTLLSNGKLTDLVMGNYLRNEVTDASGFNFNQKTVERFLRDV